MTDKIPTQRLAKEHGSAYQATLATQNLLMRAGEKVAEFNRLVEILDEDMIFVNTIRFRIPRETGEQFLAVIKADTEDGPKVAFHTGETFFECQTGLFNRMKNKSLKWKEDEYA